MKAKIAALLLVAGMASLWAESTPPKALLILSKSGQTLSIVDPSSLKVIASMPSGPDPHEAVSYTHLTLPTNREV